MYMEVKEETKVGGRGGGGGGGGGGIQDTQTAPECMYILPELHHQNI